jgi:hypothetical protein
MTALAEQLNVISARLISTAHLSFGEIISAFVCPVSAAASIATNSRNGALYLLKVYLRAGILTRYEPEFPFEPTIPSRFLRQNCPIWQGSHPVCSMVARNAKPTPHGVLWQNAGSGRHEGKDSNARIHSSNASEDQWL